MSHPARSALAGIPDEQILNMAVSNLNAAAAYTMTGRLFRQGGPADFTARVVRGTGYENTISEPGHGTVTILGIDSAAWMKADDEYLRAFRRRRVRRHASALAGKYLRCSSAALAGEPPGLGKLTGIEDLVPGSVSRGVPALTSNPQLIPLLGMSGNALVHVGVTDTSPPQIVEVSVGRCCPVCWVTVTYDSPAALTAPPADQTIDGEPYGL